MEARRYGIIRELIDSIKKRQDQLERTSQEAELNNWVSRLEMLGDLTQHVESFNQLVDIGLRIAGGELTLLGALASNLGQIKKMLRLVEEMGDLDDFRTEVTQLQESAARWHEHPETYGNLVAGNFENKLRTFEEIVAVLGSVTLRTGI